MAGKRYSNLDNINNDKSLADLWKWMRSRPKKKVAWNVPQHVGKEPAWLRDNRGADTITWIGHSTFLIQRSGVNIVTDPVWAARMGSTRRLSAPGLGLEELPPIDIVLISHSHYDHLDYGAFMLADDTPLEAAERLDAAWSEQALPPDKLHKLELGETRRL